MSLDEPANGKQCRYIALLCMRLGIRQPLEEQPMSRGEAGVRIRDLKNSSRKEVSNGISNSRTSYGCCGESD